MAESSSASSPSTTPADPADYILATLVADGLHIPRSTVRGWAHRRLIRTAKDTRGRLYVHRHDLAAVMETSPDNPDPHPSRHHGKKLVELVEAATGQTVDRRELAATTRRTRRRR